MNFLIFVMFLIQDIKSYTRSQRASTMVVPNRDSLNEPHMYTSFIYNFLIKVPIKDSMTSTTIH